MLVKALGLAIREKQEEIVKMITAAGADVKDLFLTVKYYSMLNECAWLAATAP